MVVVGFDAGADPDAGYGFEGLTPLQSATGWGRVHTTAAIAVLLNAGANPNVRDHMGITPLHRVADRGDSTAVAWLLDAGANANVQNQFGWTPLHDAAKQGYTAAMAALLDAGAIPNVQENGGGRRCTWLLRMAAQRPSPCYSKPTLTRTCRRNRE